MRRRVQKLGAWARTWGRVRQVLRESLVRFYSEDSLMVSASIAYYSLLSLFPLMLLLLGLSGILIRHYEFAGQLPLVLERYLPIKTDFIMRNLVSISKAYGRVSLLSILLLLWSSSGMFLPLEKSLNRSWEVEKGRGWWRSRLLALEMSMILGFLILLSTVLMGANVYIHSLLNRWSPEGARALSDLAYHALLLTSTFLVTLAMFLVLFQRLPNRPLQLRQVLPSALLTALFWEAARSLFTLLLPLFNYRHVYGSLGVVVALMTWAYISSAVTLFGAQVSRALYGTLKVSLPAEAAMAAVPSPADVL
jgi:membrane protein/epoxyqueuosine reductase